MAKKQEITFTSTGTYNHEKIMEYVKIACKIAQRIIAKEEAEKEVKT